MNIKNDNYINLPNFVSLFRIIMILPMIYFIINENQLGIIIVVFFSFLSDYLDGYFARRLNIITEFGKIIDPLADKLFIIAVVVTLFLMNKIDLIFFLMIILRDLLIFLGGLYITSKIGYVLPSNKLGKLTVNILALNLFFILLNFQFYLNYFRLISIFFIVISFFSYLYRAYVILHEETKILKL